MNPTPRTRTQRLTCAAGAAIATTLVGLFIHALSRHHDAGAAQQAAAHPVVVAQAHHPR